MKFKSPDGWVFCSMQEAKFDFCATHNCIDCALEKHANEQGETCGYYAACHPDEAARLMGYEVIEDDCDQTATDSNHEAKSDGGKPRPSLVPPALIRGVDSVREYGCMKYSDPENWRKVVPQRYWDALLRHVLAAWDNWKAVDPESGMPHLWHIACNAAFLMQYMEEEKGEATKHLP
ncbi:MAG TPA: hypothetical protein H9707_01360 [Candidatus Butyricicoccus avicola]|nr:hypothetical protein [Candidatus Butyricicoccus avicola]